MSAPAGRKLTEEKKLPAESLHPLPNNFYLREKTRLKVNRKKYAQLSAGSSLIPLPVLWMSVCQFWAELM
jgi:hypothetical protein